MWDDIDNIRRGFEYDGFQPAPIVKREKEPIRKYSEPPKSSSRCAIWWRERTAKFKALGLTSRGKPRKLKEYRPRTGITYDRAAYMRIINAEKKRKEMKQ